MIPILSRNNKNFQEAGLTKARLFAIIGREVIIYERIAV
nr:MAG TPA: hypothetical protein [Bacteriophage sp.]